MVRASRYVQGLVLLGSVQSVAAGGWFRKVFGGSDPEPSPSPSPSPIPPSPASTSIPPSPSASTTTTTTTTTIASLLTSPVSNTTSTTIIASSPKSESVTASTSVAFVVAPSSTDSITPGSTSAPTSSTTVSDTSSPSANASSSATTAAITAPSSPAPTSATSAPPPSTSTAPTASATPAPPSPPGCTFENAATRREWRELSEDEKNKFINAVKKMRDVPGTVPGAANRYEDFAAQHTINAPVAHGVAGFLPWHRWFLHEFELELKKIDPSIVLPYWDWSLDSQAPERSPLLTPAAFGGNGDSRQGGSGCVTDGAFAGWTRSLPERGCLTRQFDGTRGRIQPYHSPEQMESIVNEQPTSYDRFRTQLESVPHGRVHVGIGGDMNTMASPNDPLFWLHHANVDRYWWLWQQKNPSLAKTYSGAGATSPNDEMPPFNIRVSDTLDTLQGQFCYKYSAGVLPATPGAPRPGLLGRRQGTPKNGTATYTIPDAEDRDDMYKIRYVPPLPEDYIKRNYLQVDMVRHCEAKFKSVVESVNQLVSYVSPAALLNLVEGIWKPAEKIKELAGMVIGHLTGQLTSKIGKLAGGLAAAGGLHFAHGPAHGKR
ncbi:hypothetical protein HK102_001471 [Quaeritorhiza haematococci]|nr:hypothetical protein HK102_001471 [Quaeritorhiza haematococci]